MLFYWKAIAPGLMFMSSSHWNVDTGRRAHMETKRLEPISHGMTRRTRIPGRYRNPEFSGKRLGPYGKASEQKGRFEYDS
jgi:hypothetical protein